VTPLLASTLLLLLTPSLALAAGGDEPSLGFAVLKMIAALAICLGLLFGGMHLLRRFKLVDRLQGDAVIKVVSTRSLGPKRYVSVVDVAGNLLVLGVAEGGVTLLTKLSSLGVHNGEPRRPRRPGRAGIEGEEEF